MPITTIPLHTEPDGAVTFAVIKFESPLAVNDPVVRRARELVRATGNKAMLESFNASLANGALLQQ